MRSTREFVNVRFLRGKSNIVIDVMIFHLLILFLSIGFSTETFWAFPMLRDWYC
jgi:hypothetical protein